MHRVGIDLRVLQVGHQFRGIGEHTKHLISHFPTAAGFDETEFTFYTYSDLNDPTAFVKSALKGYPRYTVEQVGAAPKALARPLRNYLSRVSYDYRHINEDRLVDAQVDSMLFIDFQLGVPADASYQKTLIMYDLIPHLFSEQYHPSFAEGRRQGATVRAAGTDAYRQWQYTRALTRAVRHADKLLAISEHTKKDLVSELSVPAGKVEAIPLGVDPPSKISTTATSIVGATATDQKAAFDPQAEEFVFYIGGSDFRRRIPHLFEAFESLKPSQPKLKLVLAGADFDSLETVSDRQFKESLGESDYAEDIYFLGYIDEAERTGLYQHALAFVYPTLYEGFGLPILEAMSYGCPVITYANSSTTEVGGDAAFYATNVAEIAKFIEQLATDPKLRDDHRSRGLERVQAFRWPETANRTLAALLKEFSTKTADCDSTR